MPINLAPEKGLQQQGNRTEGDVVYYHGKSIGDPMMREKLSVLGRLLDRPIHITSGDRTEKDQARLLREGYKPAKNSEHLNGRAADIKVEGMTPEEVALFARQVGFNGIGIYPGHLHLDTRSRPATWRGSY